MTGATLAESVACGATSPTAQQSSEEGQETAERVPKPERAGLGTTAHEPPE
jgi:hypothetical protein